MLNLQVTKKEGVHGQWRLHLTRVLHRGAEKAELWSVIRHQADRPFIPPLCEILTVDGWSSVISNHSQTLYVGETRLEEILVQESVTADGKKALATLVNKLNEAGVRV